MNLIKSCESANRAEVDKRATPRRPVSLPARMMWKDQHGAARFAGVVIRDISEFGVYVESRSPLSLPLFRLVQFQLEPDVRNTAAVPVCLQQGRILSAVYRVTPPRASKPQGIALRLMVDPRRAAAVEATRATA